MNLDVFNVARLQMMSRVGGFSWVLFLLPLLVTSALGAYTAESRIKVTGSRTYQTYRLVCAHPSHSPLLPSSPYSIIEEFINVWTLVRTGVSGEYSGLTATAARERLYNLQADAAVVDIAVSVSGLLKGDWSHWVFVQWQAEESMQNEVRMETYFSAPSTYAPLSYLNTFAGCNPVSILRSST